MKNAYLNGKRNNATKTAEYYCRACGLHYLITRKVDCQNQLSILTQVSSYYSPSQLLSGILNSTRPIQLRNSAGFAPGFLNLLVSYSNVRLVYNLLNYTTNMKNVNIILA